MDWDNDIEKILESLRINSNNLSEYHKEKYYYYKGLLKYFKIPIIILSSITSVISVGLNSFVKQNTVSVIICLLSLSSAIIGSIELYLGIQKTMEIEYDTSKQFKILSYDIYKILNLKRENRNVSSKTFLDNKFNEYIRLIEQSNLIHNKKIKDALAPIPKEYIIKSNTLINESPKSSENSSLSSLENSNELSIIV